ncbi:ExeM/NucH family extracellular endonuclease [Massilia horti]|uniref:ExeM/NucH family extracellular endonuclease n=2 Tax=Massilia horti TaxID=2562153 RepID=A0A4Y9T6C7_9BURK|nr:ExeM/NucH family extracellular endonuclease [Massilia horti]
MLVGSIHPPVRLAVLAALLAAAGAALAAPAGPSDLVISQVYGAGGNNGAAWNRDFIELFNRGSTTINLNGMSVQYQSETGTTWQATKLPDFALKPGQYFLVGGATNNAAIGADIGAQDQTGSLNLSGTTGKVALARVGTAMTTPDGGNDVIDMVGFGGANRFETAVAPSPSTVNSIQRQREGCVDTDNNAADFFAAPVVGPRRTSTPLHLCGAPEQKPIVPNCPAAAWARMNNATSALLTASDEDSIVNAASITSAAVPGITLGAFTPAAAVGGTGSVSLEVDASVAPGIYPVVVRFANNDAQNASCTVSVKIAGVHTVPQIQGSGPTSPYNNTAQSTEGVVTHKVAGAFYIQDPVGDGDPTTSDGIYVFGSAGGAMVGDLVRVTGTVTEYTPSGAPRSLTEIKDLLEVTRLGSGYTIAPTNIELHNADLARYEGMLVRVTTPLTVNQNAFLADRGELVLSYGRREVPTNRYRPGTPEARAMAAANDANILVLDDNIFTTPATVPYLGEDGTVRSGDTVTDLIGALDYGSIGGSGAAFKLQPTQTPTFTRTNPREPAPQLAPGNLKVASANVLNFFTTFTDGTDAWGRTGQGCALGNKVLASNCRGASNMEEFVRQRDKIVAALVGMDADVVGLMELQNSGDTTVGYLVDQLNAALGSTVYAYVPQPPATGTDAIRVGMIYKPASVSLVGGALSDGASVNNRPPMAQTFKANNNGAKFSLIVNHLKAKSGCSGAGAGDTDSGDGQSCWNKTRVQQAQRLLDYFIPLVVATSGDPDVLVVGDMNAHGFEDPIDLYTTNGLVNEIERFVRPRDIPYSYVFDGQSGYLDHALASTSLDSQVVDVAEWHNNADEPTALDYKQQDLYVNGPYRASDHDPVVLSLNLTPLFTDMTGSVKIAQGGLTVNRFTGKYSGTVTFTNTGTAPINGPLQFVLAGLGDGVTLDNKSGDMNGAPYITLQNASLAPGASVSVTTTFSNPSKVSIVYTPKLYSGTF